MLRNARMWSTFAAVGAIAALTLAVSASAGRTGSAQTPLKIAVGMTEFKFALKPKAASKRLVVFAVQEQRRDRAQLQDRGQEDAGDRRGEERYVARRLQEGGALPVPLHPAESCAGRDEGRPGRQVDGRASGLERARWRARGRRAGRSLRMSRLTQASKMVDNRPVRGTRWAGAFAFPALLANCPHRRE